LIEFVDDHRPVLAFLVGGRVGFAALAGCDRP